MNGELNQIAVLVSAAKNALKNNREINYSYLKYENKIEFHFLSSVVAPNVEDWFEKIRECGIEDIKLLCPTEVRERGVLGFSNTTKSGILCFYKNGQVTYFTPYWQFDKELQMWNILYAENIWENPPKDKPVFENNVEEFQQVLRDIAQFARQIEFENFAKLFEQAIVILENNGESAGAAGTTNLPQLPEPNRRLYEAASIADVFGAMGSWNDSPPYYAHEKGLDKEYDTLSASLLKNVRQAVLYAVNEW